MIVAATGHRPDKLGGYNDKVRNALRELAAGWFEDNPQCTSVISGMAQGWDQAVAEAALDAGLPLLAAVPFDGQEDVWPVPAKERYKQILDRATQIVVVSPGGYAANKLSKRNAWMVDHADMLLALHDGSSGGTGNCIKYAKAKDVKIDNIWPLWLLKWRSWWENEDEDEKPKKNDGVWVKGVDIGGWSYKPSKVYDSYYKEDPIHKYLKTYGT